MLIKRHWIIGSNGKGIGSSSLLILFCLFCILSSPGCSVIISSATSDMMSQLSAAILDNDDVAMVEAGAPAYLLLIDSLAGKDSENEKMLSTAALLYSAYSDVFVKDKERSRKMSGKALDYADRAICLANDEACGLRTIGFETFEEKISTTKARDVPFLFTLGNAWAGWIMANTDDFNAIADMARIEMIMQRIIELDPSYRDGSAYLYLGTLATLVPPALGGKPEEGKAHFEKALELSNGKNFTVKLLYAKQYARMIFDQELHDRLLEEVVAQDPNEPGYTLVNTWAKEQARELLKSSNDYF